MANMWDVYTTLKQRPGERLTALDIYEELTEQGIQTNKIAVARKMRQLKGVDGIIVRYDDYAYPRGRTGNTRRPGLVCMYQEDDQTQD